MAVDEDRSRLRGVEAADERDDRRFAGAAGANQRSDAAGPRLKADVAQHRLVFHVGEVDIIEAYIAVELAELQLAVRAGVLLHLVKNFGGAVEAGQGFGDLRTDGHELNDRRDHEGEQHRVLYVITGVQTPCRILVRAKVHDQATDDAKYQGGRKRHQRLRRERTDDVLQQPLHAASEDLRFALFGVIALDDADATQRLRQPPCDLRIDLGALAEDWPDGLEGLLKNHTEDQEDAQGQYRHAHVERHQDDEDDERRQHPANKIQQTGAHQVPYTFNVGHDAGD